MASQTPFLIFSQSSKHLFFFQFSYKEMCTLKMTLESELCHLPVIYPQACHYIFGASVSSFVKQGQCCAELPRFGGAE